MTLLRVTSRCNQRCLFCSYPWDGVERKEGLKAWLREIRRWQHPLVQISGGEPLLRRFEDLLVLLDLCAKRGIQVEFQTNAAAAASFSRPRLRRLVEAVGKSRGYFNVNSPADNAELDARITGVRGHFRKREKAVLQLLEAGASVRLTHIVHALSYRRIPKFISYVAERLRGVSWIQFSFVKALGRASADRQLVPSYRQASKPLCAGLRLARSAGIKCEVDHIPPCFLEDLWACHVDVRKLLARKHGPHEIEKGKTAECLGCRFASCCAGPRLDYLTIHKTLGRSPVQRAVGRLKPT